MTERLRAGYVAELATRDTRGFMKLPATTVVALASEVMASRRLRCDACAFYLLEPDIEDYLCHRDAPGVRFATPADWYCASFTAKEPGR